MTRFSWETMTGTSSEARYFFESDESETMMGCSSEARDFFESGESETMMGSSSEARDFFESGESETMMGSSSEARDFFESGESEVEDHFGEALARTVVTIFDYISVRHQVPSYKYWFGKDVRVSRIKKKNQTEQEQEGGYSYYTCSSPGKNKSINIITRHVLEERINSALPIDWPGQYYSVSVPNILIQFWASMVTNRRGRCVLTTRNLPFGLRRIEGGLSEYRKHCRGLEFIVNVNLDDDDDDDDEFGDGVIRRVFRHDDDDDDEFGGGVIGRVFRREQMESTPDVSYYSVTEYPQRDFALKFGIRGSLALPVIEPDDGSCYGVLELVDCTSSLESDDSFHPHHLYQAAEEITKGGHLKTYLPLELQIVRGTNEVIEEINKALQLVCTAHQLPLAQIWIPRQTSHSISYFDNYKKSCYLYCTNTFSSVYQGVNGYRAYQDLVRLNHICKYNYLSKGQGIVGKALLYHKPCFCRDVSELPIAKYPLSHYTRKYGLTSCFAICIHGSPTKDHDYVLEFFLPPWNKISKDPQAFLESLFPTVKKHLQGFEICSGGGLGEELGIEVLNISMKNEPNHFRICQAAGIQPIYESLQSEREELQNKVTGEVVIDNGSNVFGAEQNDMGLASLDKRVEILEKERENEVGKELFVEITKSATNVEITTILPPPMPESLQNEIKVVELSGDESTMDSVMENVLKVIVPEQNDVAVTSDREHETNELSREDDANRLAVRKKELNVAISKKKSSVAVTTTSNLNHVKEVGEELLVEAALNDEITTAVSPTPESLQNETEVLQLLDESPMEAVTKNEVNGIEVVQLSDDESTGETAIKNESNVLVADQYNLAVTSSERICRVGTSERAHKIIESSHEDLKQHYREKLDDDADGLRGRISGRAEVSEKIVYRTTDILISHEDLIKHFGEKLDDVAAFFNVSRSSVQRACRLHGIGKWPLPRRKKANASSTSNLKHRKEVVPKKRKKKVNPSSTSNLKHLKEVVPKKMKEVNSPSNSNLEHVKEAVPKKRKEVNAPSTSNLQHVKEFVPKKQKKVVNASSTSNLEHVKEVVPKKRKKGNPSCSTSPPLHPTAAAVLAHTIRNAPPEQDVGIMDTKVKYGNTTLRFDLPVTARKRDLMEMVTQRLPLNVSFDIEYQDEENEWILIAIDKDLENGIRISGSLRKSPMLILKITNHVP